MTDYNAGELDVHALPGPYISGSPATFLSIHGSRDQLRLIDDLTRQAEHVLAFDEPQRCQRHGSNGCWWLHLVAVNWVDPARIGHAYQDATDRADATD